MRVFILSIAIVFIFACGQDFSPSENLEDTSSDEIKNQGLPENDELIKLRKFDYPLLLTAYIGGSQNNVHNMSQFLGSEAYNNTGYGNFSGFMYDNDYKISLNGVRFGNEIDVTKLDHLDTLTFTIHQGDTLIFSHTYYGQNQNEFDIDLKLDSTSSRVDALSQESYPTYEIGINIEQISQFETNDKYIVSYYDYTTSENTTKTSVSQLSQYSSELGAVDSSLTNAKYYSRTSSDSIKVVVSMLFI
jgi:hypothetical protein